jgi:hypothetical protein
VTIDVSWWERVPDWAWVVGGIFGGTIIFLTIVAIIIYFADL